MLSMTASAFVRYRFAFGLVCLCLGGTTVGAEEPAATLAAHWPLVSDARAAVGTTHAESRGEVQFKTLGGRPAAVFNGRDAYF